MQEADTDLIARLDELLDLERAALLAGDFDRLDAMTAEKEALVERINTKSSIGQTQLETVQRKVTRNQSLLNNALDGINAVAARIAELKSVRQGLDTYDQSGNRHRFASQVHKKLEKRA